MKIVIVSQFFDPEPVPIPGNLVRGLIRRGHDVRVVTGYPNYPAGKLVSGYRQRFNWSEPIDGVKVNRVPIIVSHSQNSIGRIANYVSFGLSSLSASRIVRGADVVYVYGTPMTAAIAPQLWRLTLGIPFVLHVQDLWPESITGSTMAGNGTAKRFIGWALAPWLRALYRGAGWVIAIAPTMQKMLVDRGAPAERISTIPNWGIPAESPNSVGRRAPTEDEFVVSYSGNLGDLQDLENVIRAAHLVRDLPNFKIIIAGTGVAEDRLRRLASELGVISVDFVGRLEGPGMAELYRRSRFQLVTLKALDIFRGTIPSKFQGALAQGIPLITTVHGDVAALVRQHTIGLVAEPENAESLAGAFRQCYAMTPTELRTMSDRAQRFFSDNLSFESVIESIEGALSRAAESRK